MRRQASWLHKVLKEYKKWVQEFSQLFPSWAIPGKLNMPSWCNCKPMIHSGTMDCFPTRMPGLVSPTHNKESNIWQELNLGLEEAPTMLGGKEKKKSTSKPVDASWFIYCNNLNKKTNKPTHISHYSITGSPLPDNGHQSSSTSSIYSNS